jgi:hypothetical protein
MIVGAIQVSLKCNLSAKGAKLSFAKASLTRAVSTGVLALLSLSALVGSAAAGSMYSYDGYSVVDEVNVTIGTKNPLNPLVAALPGGFQNGYFGSGQIILDGTSGIDLAVWCIDATHDLQSIDTYTIVKPSPSLTDNGGIGGLGNTLSSTVLGEIGALVYWGDANIHDPNVDYSISAAVQLAIWTIEYPNGTFTSDDPNVNTAVNTFLVPSAESGATGFKSNTNLFELIDPTNPNGNQGLVFTPLPSSWTMLLAGLAGLALFARSRRRIAQTV